MSATVIILLISLWAAVLLPGLVRARRETSPATSVSRFNRSMDLLERTRLGPPAQPVVDEVATDSGEEDFPMGRVPARHRAQRRGLSWPASARQLVHARPRRAWRRRPRGGARRLAPPPPPVAGERRPSSDVVARRRAVLAVLAAVTLLGALLAPLTRVGLVVLSLGIAALAAYIALLWQLQRQRELRRRVRHLERAPVSGPAPPPAARAVGESLGG